MMGKGKKCVCFHFMKKTARNDETRRLERNNMTSPKAGVSFHCSLAAECLSAQLPLDKRDSEK
jgi:hypothetical protein